MPHSSYFDGFGVGANEEDTIVTDAEPQLIPALQRFHISNSELSESMKYRKDVHRNWFT